jgi:hypothetical protein
MAPLGVKATLQSLPRPSNNSTGSAPCLSKNQAQMRLPDTTSSTSVSVGWKAMDMMCPSSIVMLRGWPVPASQMRTWPRGR